MKKKWNERWRYIVLSVDCGAGLLVGAVTYLASSKRPTLRQPHLLDVSTGISVAVLAVVIASMAILAAMFLNDDYRLIVKEALGDARRAFEPYKVVAIVSGADAFASVAGLFIWPIAPGWTLSLVLAISLGLATWSVMGAVQLVGITATQSHQGTRVPEIYAAYLKARETRKSTKS
jgi:hypothetical protein